jgi:SecD/SecF fusion protein
MKKSKSIVALLLVLILTAGVGYTVLFGIGDRGKAEYIKRGLDLQGGVSITYEVADDDFSDEDFSDTKRKMELRAYDFSEEAEVYQEGDNRITVDIPGEDDAEAVLADLGKPGALQFITYTGEEDDPDTEDDESIKVWLDGSDIKDAQPSTSTDKTTSTTEYVVNLTMTDEGTEKFAEATTENVGEILYVMYDGEIISSPVVQNAITGGEAEINGMSDYDEADSLASQIRIGSLKLELNEISHKVVGAKLGTDALSKSVKAGIIGFILVCIFMILMYRASGVAAAIALIVYICLDLLTLNAFNLTLTLPGIAGIILSVGMAVDANVIIYSRIREEIAAGRDTHAAIKTGFSKATSAIVDGNVTTIIASFVLMWKGSGSVQGFAQTLAIGIIWSMITALVISRILMYAIYGIGCKSPKFYGKEKKRKPINFVGKKAIFFTISIVVVLGGLVVMGVNSAKDKGAFEYSIEFQGGKSYTVDFDKEYSIDDFNDTLKPAIADVIKDNDIQGQKESDSNRFIIKVKDIDESLITDMKAMLVSDYGAKEDSFEETYISASVSKEMTEDAVVATIIATICMLLYIWLRFKDIRFAASAVLALLHDVMVVLAFYAVSRISVGTTFIACILTIVGYSINATIVIFDRIRENMAIMDKKTTLKDLVNTSITQTLTRSIYTSFTTFLTVAMIYIMGVSSIKDFALALMVGIICGAYSSVCVTGALWYVMRAKLVKRVKERRK